MATRTRSRSRAAHPRVQARRAAVARERGRWRTRAVVILTGLFTLGGLGWLAVHSSLLDLERVDVRGSRRADAGEVREAVSVRLGEPLLLVDRGSVASRVEALPWVARAEVEWSLPGTLVVEIAERTPVGWVSISDEPAEGSDDGDAAGVALVDETGRVLDVRGRPPARLVQLDHRGAVPEPGGRLEHAESLLAIASTVPEGLRDRVRAVHRASTGFVLAVEGVEVVRFGAAEDLPRKWSALEAVLDELGDRSVYLVDVRVPSVPAVSEQERAPDPEPTDPGDGGNGSDAANAG